MTLKQRSIISPSDQSRCQVAKYFRVTPRTVVFCVFSHKALLVADFTSSCVVLRVKLENEIPWKQPGRTDWDASVETFQTSFRCHLDLTHFHAAFCFPDLQEVNLDKIWKCQQTDFFFLVLCPLNPILSVISSSLNIRNMISDLDFCENRLYQVLHSRELSHLIIDTVV